MAKAFSLRHEGAQSQIHCAVKLCAQESGGETRAHPRWHASLRNDTGVDGKVKGQGCSALQIRNSSSIAQALAAMAKRILPWQRASPSTGGGAGAAAPGPGWWWGGEEEERDVRHHHWHRFCGRRGFRLQSRCPAKSIEPTEIESRKERKPVSCQK